MTPFSIEAYLSTSRCKLITKVPIKFNTLGSVLGFDCNNIYVPGTHFSRNKIDITYFSTINIECSIAKGDYISDKDKNVQSSNIIHSFSAHSVPPGYRYFEQRNPSIYFRISTKKIKEIRFKTTDERGNLIDFNKEEINF